MGQFFPVTVLNQQMSTDEIGETGAVLDAIVADDGATWGKFGSSEEISQLLSGMLTGSEEGKPGEPCGHHEQVNRKAEWPLRGLLGPVGDTNPVSLPLGSRLAVSVFSIR